jgi:hypothetical protein
MHLVAFFDRYDMRGFTRIRASAQNTRSVLHLDGGREAGVAPGGRVSNCNILMEHVDVRGLHVV